MDYKEANVDVVQCSLPSAAAAERHDGDDEDNDRRGQRSIRSPVYEDEPLASSFCPVA